MILQDNKILLLFVFSSESWEEKCAHQRTLECFREGRALESISAGPTDELLVQDLDVLGPEQWPVRGDSTLTCSSVFCS